ncbi:MAG: hypothetical protein JOZ53_04460 [Planctomycetaceae bacterium]|nr:hypothetical protein [Planctomycetaceae bacterium]
MSKSRKKRRDQRHARVADQFAEAVRWEVSPHAALQAQMDRVGARALDADGPEATEFFWRQHARWRETFDSPRIEELIADGTSQEDRVAATRAQIELAAAWARAGRVDLGLILLQLLELGGRRALAYAAVSLGLLVGESQKFQSTPRGNPR